MPLAQKVVIILAAASSVAGTAAALTDKASTAGTAGATAGSMIEQPSMPHTAGCPAPPGGFLGHEGCDFQDSAQTGAGITSQSLNSDPYNLRAEELAMQDCMQGVDIRRTWSEKEMVRAIDGRVFPGTPDGMFENWDGALTCVQVVRVPLVPESDLHGMQETLALTIMTKIVKSQQWLRASHIVPDDFIIYCWLPFSIAPPLVEHAEALMQQVRLLDPRFSLRLRVPAQPGALFPALFASNHDLDLQKARGYSWSDITTYPGSEPESDEEECTWDITWGWEEDWAAEMEEEDSDDGEVSWDITWGWEDDWLTNEAQKCELLRADAPGAELEMGKRGCTCKVDSENAWNKYLFDDGG